MVHHSPEGLMGTSPIVHQSQMVWVPVFKSWVPQCGVEPFTPKGELWVLRSLPIVGRHTRGGVMVRSPRCVLLTDQVLYLLQVHSNVVFLLESTWVACVFPGIFPFDLSLSTWLAYICPEHSLVSLTSFL